MKLTEILMEVPLPPDWDKEVYSPNMSFAQRIRYAKQRAQQLGVGSSRVAFEIPYQGRMTVLKVAKNKKGMAQNEYEAGFLDDYYAMSLGIIIPLIDYDEENDPPTWIHTEKAEKATKSAFKKYFSGLDPNELIRVVKYGTGKLTIRDEETANEYQRLIEENDAIDSLIDLVGNYDIPPDDFSRLANWGIYDNKLVIIDIGGSTEVMKKYYNLK